MRDISPCRAVPGHYPRTFAVRAPAGTADSRMLVVGMPLDPSEYSGIGRFLHIEVSGRRDLHYVTGNFGPFCSCWPRRCDASAQLPNSRSNRFSDTVLKFGLVGN